MSTHRSQEYPHSDPHSDPLLVRPTEAARLLGVGRTTIYNMIGKGELHVVHIGRAARISMRDLQLWVEQRRADTID